MTFKLIMMGDTDSFQKAVQDHLDDGWTLHGGSFIMPWASGRGIVCNMPSTVDEWVHGELCQAVTK